MNIVYPLLIPFAVYLVVRQLDRHYRVKGSRLLLIAACILFGISVFLPSPIIAGEDTEFFTHVFGGGFFTGMLWLYFKPVIKKNQWYVELLYLFLLVSSLGVINELFELFLHTAGITPEPLTDTSWDLLANTLGVAVFYGCYQGVKYAKRLFIQR